MNFLQLQDLTLMWLDDVNAGYMTRPQVKRLLNNGLRELQKQLVQAENSWYTLCAQTSTITNKDSYSLPADFFKLQRLTLFTQGSGTLPSDISRMLTPTTPVESLSVPQGPGCPVSYFLKKNCIVLRPYPDTAYPMTLLYDYLVSEMVFDTETPDAPIQFHEYIALLATRDGLLRDQRDATQFQGKITMYEELMRQDADQRTIDAPRDIVSTEDDGYEVFF